MDQSGRVLDWWKFTKSALARGDNQFRGNELRRGLSVLPRARGGGLQDQALKARRSHQTGLRQ